MSKSILIRVDTDFAKTIRQYKINITRVTGKPVTAVEITRIINGKIHNGILSADVISCNKRRKRVLL